MQYKDFNTKRKVDKLISKEQNEIMREDEIKNLIKEVVKRYFEDGDYKELMCELKLKLEESKTMELK